jgi:hypothetical protein
MLSPPSSPGIPGYNDYRAPTEAERWSEACRAAGLSVGRVSGAEPLTRAVQALSAQGGPSTAVARSIEIRMRTHTRLAAKSLAFNDGGQG